MATTRKLSILAEPPGPDFLAMCPHCNRRMALTPESTAADEKVGKLRTYSCHHCGATIVFADRHPPECV